MGVVGFEKQSFWSICDSEYSVTSGDQGVGFGGWSLRALDAEKATDDLLGVVICLWSRVKSV